MKENTKKQESEALCKLLGEFIGQLKENGYIQEVMEENSYIRESMEGLVTLEKQLKELATPEDTERTVTGWLHSENDRLEKEFKSNV